jgi:selenocysteine lyase/cysteine desulfurase
MTAAPPAPPLAAAWRAEFPILGTCTYLNSCSLGALSRRARAKVNEHLDLWEMHGASAWYEIWWQALADLRAGYGRVVGAPAGSIALHPSATSALTAVAESLDYAARPKIVTTALDFPTVPYQWLVKPGVEVVILESDDGISVPVEKFAAAIDERTAIVATTHVVFTSGMIQPVAEIARLARAKGALCLVDGYQAAGQIDVDVRALDVDFYISGGLKWLLGGTGTAFLYARPELHDQLSPRATGWFSHAEQFRFDPRHHAYADDARRLEMGTPALMPVYAQLGGLSILEEIGLPRVRQETMALTEDLIEQAQLLGLRPRVAPRAEDRTAIVMLPSADPHAEVRALKADGFVTDARPGHVRVSPFFYNTPDEHRAFLARLVELRTRA